MCSTSKHLSRVAEPIDAFVTEHVLARLARADLAEMLAPAAPDLSGLREQAAALRGRRLALADDISMDEVILKRRDRALAAKLAEIEGLLDQAQQDLDLADFVGAPDVEAIWEDRDLDRKRAVVARLVTVTVLPVGTGQRRFTKDSVRVAPRSRA